jgi:ribosome biogenesis GTPase A
MSQDFCRGCGSVLQTIDPNAPGYIPESVLQKRKQLICRRCYRITHYNDAGTTLPEEARIKKNIKRAISLSRLLIVVIDFSDLTGTLPVWAGYLGVKPYFLVVNKSDLLPFAAKPDEVQAYINRYLHDLQLPSPQRTIMVSALKGNGVGILGEQIKKFTAANDKAAFLGVTNVGKSSLVKQILKAEGATNTPTVSKIHGTTMGLSNWSIFKGRNTIIDTPGLDPQNRIGDLLCQECSGRLLVNTKLQSKLWGLKPGKALIIGGIVALELPADDERVFIAFTGETVDTHRTDNTKVAEILANNPDWLKGVCRQCFQKIQWQEHQVELENGMDVAVAGLGWVTLRGAAARVKIRLPQGVKWEIRPGLVGKKNLK